MHPWLEEFDKREDLLKLHTARDTGRSFVHHDPEGQRIRIDYFWHPIDKELLAPVSFGQQAEGPPGCAHGGSIAAVMDDAMGTTAWASGHRVVALNLTVDYRTFVVLDTPMRVVARVTRTDGRKVYTEAALSGADGKVHAEGQGLFYEIDFAKLLTKQPAGPVA